MPTYQIQMSFAIGAKDFDYATFVFKDIVTEELAYYEFFGKDRSKGLKLPASATIWSDWSDTFVAACPITAFNKVRIVYGGVSAVVKSYWSYLMFADGPIAGTKVNIGGYQVGTPGAGVTEGILTFDHYVKPIDKGWPEGHFLIGVWAKYGIGFNEGFEPKFWGTLTLSNRRVDFNQFSSIDSRLTWPWMWSPDTRKLPEAPATCSGKWDLPSAQKAAIYQPGDLLFAELEQFVDVLTGGRSVGGNNRATIDNKIRNGEQDNGWMMSAAGRKTSIWWILANRD
jgi:hypothetical protein